MDRCPERTPTQRGTKPWSRLSSLLRRQLDRIVHPRLTEILVEVADIRVGAGEACPFRVGIRAGARARPLHGGARVAAVFASLPAAVAGIGVCGLVLLDRLRRGS